MWSKKRNKWIARPFVTEAGDVYKQHVRNITLEKKAWFYSEEPLHLRVCFCFKDDRVQDLDNRVKSLQDCLKYAGVFKDDSQVILLEARRGPNLKPAVCFIWLDEVVPDRLGNLRWVQNPVG